MFDEKLFMETFIQYATLKYQQAIYRFRVSSDRLGKFK